MSAPHLLLLGGTAEARELAEALAPLPLRLTVSLAGKTQRPAHYPGEIRLGGFGGAPALADWMREASVSLLVDATHPFAAAISANAAKAATLSGLPLLRLERPPWQAGPNDRWHHFASLQAAIAALPQGARAFLTTGSGSAPVLDSRSDVTLFLRSIEPLDGLPPHVHQYLARPPFSEAQERDFLEAHRITHLLSKNSGGAGRAKLDAAADRGLPVFMIERPVAAEAGQVVPDTVSALAVIADRLALDTASGPTP